MVCIVQDIVQGIVRYIIYGMYCTCGIVRYIIYGMYCTGYCKIYGMYCTGYGEIKYRN